MSYSLNSLKWVIGVITGDARSLDYSSYRLCRLYNKGCIYPKLGIEKHIGRSVSGNIPTFCLLVIGGSKYGTSLSVCAFVLFVASTKVTIGFSPERGLDYPSEPLLGCC